MPLGSNDINAGLDLSSQYPGLAKKDVKLIAGNVLGIGEKVKEANLNAKHSRKMGRQRAAAVKRLKQKKDETAAEDVLLGRALKKPSDNYHERQRVRKELREQKDHKQKPRK